MFDKMKDLMEMKKQADRIKKELDTTMVEVNAVDEALLREGNKQQLEADLLHSVNAAIRKSQEIATQKMKAVMPGFPG